jgi:oligoendopeptidase F
MSYNSNEKKAVFVEYREETAKFLSLESIRIYDLNSSSEKIIERSFGTIVNVKLEEKTIKAVQTSSIAVFTLTANKRLGTL